MAVACMWPFSVLLYLMVITVSALYTHANGMSARACGHSILWSSQWGCTKSFRARVVSKVEGRSMRGAGDQGVVVVLQIMLLVANHGNADLDP